MVRLVRTTDRGMAGLSIKRDAGLVVVQRPENTRKQAATSSYSRTGQGSLLKNYCSHLHFIAVYVLHFTGHLLPF